MNERFLERNEKKTFQSISFFDEGLKKRELKKN
jgi:hypothetical protein